MKKLIRIISVIAAIYLLVGIFYAVKFSVSYDPNYTSAPNNAITFMMNVIMGPMYELVG